MAEWRPGSGHPRSHRKLGAARALLGLLGPPEEDPTTSLNSKHALEHSAALKRVYLTKSKQQPSLQNTKHSRTVHTPPPELKHDGASRAFDELLCSSHEAPCSRCPATEEEKCLGQPVWQDLHDGQWLSAQVLDRQSPEPTPRLGVLFLLLLVAATLLCCQLPFLLCLP